MQTDQPDRIRDARAQILVDLLSVQDYALALDRSERTIQSYVERGLPTVYVGRKCFVVLSLAAEYWRSRARQRPEPAYVDAPRRVARPRKETVTA